MKYKKGDIVEFSWISPQNKTDIVKILKVDINLKQYFTKNLRTSDKDMFLSYWFEESGRILTPEEIVLYKLLGKL